MIEFDVKSNVTYINQNKITKNELKVLKQILTFSASKKDEEPISLLENNSFFLSGLIKRVVSFLDKKNLSSSFKQPLSFFNINETCKIIDHSDYILRPYQKKVVLKCMRFKRGIIQSPTGSGKTLMQATVLNSINTPSLTVVFTDLQREQLYNFYNKMGLPILKIKDIDRKNIKNVNDFHYVDTAITFTNYVRKTGHLKKLELLQYDESHHLGGPSWHSLGYLIESNYRFAWSATPLENNSKKISLRDAYAIGVTGEIICTIPVSFLINKGFLHKPKINMVRYKSPLKSPNCNNWIILSRVLHGNTQRNEKIVEIAKKLVDKNYKVLVIVDKVKHGLKLLKLISKKIENTVFAKGGKQQYKICPFTKSLILESSENFVKGLESGEYKIGIGCCNYKEAIDLPSIDAGIVACGGKSAYSIPQIIGRYIRPKGKSPLIYDFWDHINPILKYHSKKRIELYKKYEYEVIEE